MNSSFGGATSLFGSASSSFLRAMGDVAALTPVVEPFVARRPGSREPPPGTGAAGVGVDAELSAGAGAGAELGARQLPEDYLERFGMLAPLLSDPRVTDVFVNGSSGTWVDRGHGAVREVGLTPNEEQLRELAVRLVSLGGRHIDEAAPCVDTRLGDGIRVHAVLPPVSTSGTLLSVRLPSARAASLDWLESTGFFEVVPRSAVEEIVERRQNVLITGAGGSGKTTLLSAMLSSATSTNRIIAIEDVAELRVDHPHFLSLEARQANLEGAGAIGLDRLVREALRMRPDRLVLGECRGSEIRELLAALNTGHDGGAGTLHANSLEDVPARLEALGALAGMSPEAVARQAVSAIGVVLHLARPGTGTGTGSGSRMGSGGESAGAGAGAGAGASGGRRLLQRGRFVVDDRGRLATVDLAVDLAAEPAHKSAHEPAQRSRGAHLARHVP